MVIFRLRLRRNVRLAGSGHLETVFFLLEDPVAVGAHLERSRAVVGVEFRNELFLL
jgi:hypothetical protein